MIHERGIWKEVNARQWESVCQAQPNRDARPMTPKGSMRRTWVRNFFRCPFFFLLRNLWWPVGFCGSASGDIWILFEFEISFVVLFSFFSEICGGPWVFVGPLVATFGYCSCLSPRDYCASRFLARIEKQTQLCEWRQSWACALQAAKLQRMNPLSDSFCVFLNIHTKIPFRNPSPRVYAGVVIFLQPIILKIHSLPDIDEPNHTLSRHDIKNNY
jgi:hypothetical protein